MKNIRKKINISSPGLLYHLDKLEEMHFIQKITLAQIGNAKINEISLDPLQMQTIRRILGKECKTTTLLSGFGELYDGYSIPEQGFQLLHYRHYIIERVVCITTRKGKEIRDSKSKEEKLLSIDKYYADYDYLDFRNINSQFFKDIDSILRDELQNSNLIIDITPLSKLYSFEMLKRANQYQLPCYYKGKNEEQKDVLLWMTNLKLKGDFGK